MNSILASCKRCVIVDDSEHMIEIVRAVLEAFGMRGIVGEADPKHAFEDYQAHGAGLLIVDYHLGGSNGIQFVARVRNMADPEKARVPIVMMTSYTEQSRVIAAREAGVDAFVRKPITGRELYEKIAFALTRITIAHAVS
ncbi:MAG: response regulator [Alphaproteobacteria bacterium]